MRGEADRMSNQGGFYVEWKPKSNLFVSAGPWVNFDHYNAWTQYSLQQVLEHTGYQNIRVFPLNLYVFWTNPFNYVALAWDTLLRFFFLICFKMVGKSNTLFSKKIGAVGRKVNHV